MTESEEENLFREYLTSAGALVHADLALLADDENKGRKVILRADVAKGTELLRIPVNICFFAAATGPAREVVLRYLTGSTQTTFCHIESHHRAIGAVS